MQYFAIVGQGPFQEVLVTKRVGVRSTQRPTGVTYRTWREATNAIAAKNAQRSR